MPIPSPKNKEERDSFVSRCISDLASKGEGESTEQRTAICFQKWKDAKASKITEQELAALVKIKNAT